MATSKNLEDKDLYQLLQIEKDCDDKAIKKAYYKLALQLHPDKQPPNLPQAEKDLITLRFQKVGFAYSILSNKNKRFKYDKTGSTEEIGDLNSYESWSDYFNGQFGDLVTKESIEAFSKQYKKSDEEKVDVINAYVQCKGDMNKMLGSIILSECNDEDRFIDIIRDSLKNKQVEDYPLFKKTTTEKARSNRLKNEKKRQEKFEKQQKTLNKKGKGGNKEGNQNCDLTDSTTTLEALALQMQENSKRRAEQSEVFYEKLMKKYK